MKGEKNRTAIFSKSISVLTEIATGERERKAEVDGNYAASKLQPCEPFCSR